MRRPILATSALVLALSLAACVPPREHVDGMSADGRTQVMLELRPVSGDSVQGSGTLRVAGHPRTVVLRGRWNEMGDGLRSLDATLQADTTPDERWALSWSPVTLNGSLRSSEAVDGATVVALSTQ
jgi:hypothetical protein